MVHHANQDASTGSAETIEWRAHIVNYYVGIVPSAIAIGEDQRRQEPLRREKDIL